MIYLFGDKLKELRKARNITQQELASILNVTKPTISNWENNKGCADGEILIQLANYFNVSSDYLLGLTKEDLDKVERLKKALKENGIEDIETAMKIVSALKNEN